MTDLASCTLCHSAIGPPIAAWGQRSARLVFVLDCPPSEAAQDCLLYLCDQARVDAEDCYWTLATKCGGGDPNTCRARWLEAELADADPRVIVLVGRELEPLLDGLSPWQHGATVPRGTATMLLLDAPDVWIERGTLNPFVRSGDRIAELLSK